MYWFQMCSEIKPELSPFHWGGSQRQKLVAPHRATVGSNCLGELLIKQEFSFYAALGALNISTKNGD